MKKININIDRPKVSTEEISAKRDFKSLLNQYNQIEKTPFYVRYRLPLLGAAGVLIGAGVLIMMMQQKEVIAESSHEPVRSVAETLPTQEVGINTISNSEPNGKKQVNVIAVNHSNSDQTANTDSKAIPSDDVTKKDTVIATPIQPIASQEAGKKAKLSKEELDRKMRALKKEITNLKIQVRRFELQKPIKPVQATGKTFKIDVKPNEFPQLSKYHKVVFEATKDAKDFSADYFKIEWENGQLKLDSEGNYLLTISKGKETHTFNVNPVFEGNAFSDAVKQYETYQNNLDNIKEQQSQKETELNEMSKLK